MTVNSELRLGINQSLLPSESADLTAEGHRARKQGLWCGPSPAWDPLLGGEGRREINAHQTREQNSVSGEHRAIATERGGLKHLMRFLSEVKRTRFKTNATLPLVEHRGSSSMNNSLLRDSQAVFLLYSVHAREPIL